MSDLKAYLESTTDNYIHGDFLNYSRKTVTQLEDEVRQLLLCYYYTASVTVADYKGTPCVWYEAQSRI